MIGVIIASGQGKRLSSFSKTPKPLIDIAGYTLLGHTIKRFIEAEVNDIYIIVRYHCDDFRKFIKTLKCPLGFNTHIVELSEDSYIDSPINDLCYCVYSSHFPTFDNVLVSYCDVVTDFKIKDLINLHFEKDSLATLLLFSGNDKIYLHKYYLEPSSAVIIVNSFPNGIILSENILANAGIFVLNKVLLMGYNINSKIYFSTHNGPVQKAFNSKLLYGIDVGLKYFREIGNPEELLICQDEVTKSDNLKRKLFF